MTARPTPPAVDIPCTPSPTSPSDLHFVLLVAVVLLPRPVAPTLPLDVVLRRLVDQADALQDVGDVVDASLLRSCT